MNVKRISRKIIFVALINLIYTPSIIAADHNDPNAVNSIYSDVPISGADLYDIFGYPSDDKSNGEAIVVQLTFASVPKTGIFDKDLMYKVHLDASTRVGDYEGKEDLESLIEYFDAIKNKYFDFNAPEIRVALSSLIPPILCFNEIRMGTEPMMSITANSECNSN